MSFDSSDLIESLSCNNYISRNHIIEYLNDSVEQLLELKNFDPKIDVLEFFTEYFKAVLEGNHVIYRDFSFVSSTPYNRACFVQKFLELFFQLLSKDEKINSFEIHSLLMLICVNFPKNIVDKCFRILSRDDNPKIWFKDFIYLFQFQFYYHEFIHESKQIYDDTMINLDDKSNDKIKKFSEKLFILIEQSKFECPPIALIKENLNPANNDLDFFEFLHKLAVNEKLIKHIGKLPCPNELVDYEQKLNNDKNTKELKEPILSDKLNLSNFKPNDMKQKSLINISNSMGKNQIEKEIEKKSISDSSSDTDT